MRALESDRNKRFSRFLADTLSAMPQKTRSGASATMKAARCDCLSSGARIACRWRDNRRQRRVSIRTHPRRNGPAPRAPVLLFMRAAFVLAPVGGSYSMIVCSCNILSDQDVRAIAKDPAYVPPRVAEIYSRLGCNAECGRCVRTIRTIIDEAVTATLAEQEM